MSRINLSTRSNAIAHGLDPENIPRHVAVIMDGNGRWAQSRLRPRVFGHRRGADRVREIVEIANKLGIEALTLYTFSQENWRRPAGEVTALMRLLNSYIKKELPELDRNEVRLKTIGCIKDLPLENQRVLNDACDQLSENKGLVLNLALSYSSRQEIVGSLKKIAELVKSGELKIDDLNEKVVDSFMETSDLPPVDLLIRTSGEKRLSNFLLWQLAYAELYFTDVHWPEFSATDFVSALRVFQRRDRRYGALSSEEALSTSEVFSKEKDSVLLATEKTC